jgi:hypothetical protein
VNPERRNLVDSSTGEEEEERTYYSQQSESTDEFETGDEENIPPPVNVNTPPGNAAANKSPNTPPVNAAANNSSAPDSNGRRKKTKRDRLDEHFTSSSKALLEAMAAESDKRTLHTQAILYWDKQKANRHFELELVKLCEDTATRDRVGSQVANVLGELVKNLGKFTTELAKRK